ncbi:MAG: hypothetical protein HN725_22680 [Alphaproteobacteria bacterium]|jgi:hypothetical protein|nr:hypothetical protein [Alphaproteobacteria bacterium]MBT4084429.1 hypothetical protein [Alphaproteobacteria bacterium]MBT4545651.1 hypothetical protein [Alphaproteobacteria bacterium]MBT7748108.1 hypothetical protein [Alphaproteobacteria bacterium]
MKILIGTACLVGALLGLSACQTAPDDTGSGKITLTEKSKARFEDYLKLDMPLYFAISDDGNSIGYTFCPSANCADYSARYSAIQYCEVNSNGKACRIYAHGTQVVWKNPTG